MEEHLSNWLLSEAPLSALVGTRVNWLDRPSATLPAVTLQLIAANSEYTHESRSDLAYPRIQFDCWGATYTSAKKCARAVAALIEAGKDTASALFFEGIEVNNRDMPTETLSGGTKVFRVALEYLVPYQLKGA